MLKCVLLVFAIYLSYILAVTALNILRVPGTPIRSQMYHKMWLRTKNPDIAKEKHCKRKT